MLSIYECMEKRLLHVAFQPIGALASGELLGYEALLRGPAGTPLASPAALFEQARRENRMVQLELFAAALGVNAFAASKLPGKLFLNFSAAAVREIESSKNRVRNFLESIQFPLSRIVIELTEQEDPKPISILNKAITSIRTFGAKFALDDFGTGHANLDLWIALRPDYIKIDRSIINGVAKCSFQLEVVQQLLKLATSTDTRLIAEGIEAEDDLMLCRDINIPYAQGFIIGKPEVPPPPALDERVLKILRAKSIAVFPENAKVTPRAFSTSRLLVNAPIISPKAHNNDVIDILTRSPALHAIAVVDNQRPIGLINRQNFVDAYARPFHRELYGRKSCLQFANKSPTIVEKAASIEELTLVLTAQDQRYLADGLIVVDRGAYVGLLRGEDLVRAVTEVRIEAARYANPLTLLPGNIPIEAHIKRLLSNSSSFHACYCDLNSFKPFNDVYGYWQGDEMLKLAAETLAKACDPRIDFLGHVGGDDFLILYQSADWEVRIRTAMAKFNAGATTLYTKRDIAAGGIQAEDRHGNVRFYGFVSLAVGVVPVQSGERTDADTIATLAAAAKREAKKSDSNFFICSREPSLGLLAT